MFGAVRLVMPLRTVFVVPEDSVGRAGENCWTPRLPLLVEANNWLTLVGEEAAGAISTSRVFGALSTSVPPKEVPVVS